jgi:hypothetical protein
MNRKILFSSFLVFALIFSSCQRRHLNKIATNSIVKKKQKRRVKPQTADFKYLSTKSKIEYTDGLDNFTANASIRIRKDSVIWVSVSPALGVEVLRCLITKDSVFIMNKLQKEYYLFSYLDLKEKLNFDINYGLVESILFGNPPFSELDSDSSYSLSDTTFSVLLQSRKNIDINNYVKNSTLKLEKIDLEDRITGNTLNITYEDFKPLENILFAFINKISLKYRNNKGFQNIYIGIVHNKVETGVKDLKFPFNIRNRFERKE